MDAGRTAGIKSLRFLQSQTTLQEPAAVSRRTEVQALGPIARMRFKIVGEWGKLMTPTKNTARLAGVFWILASATGGFSLVYARPRLIVFSDAATTIANLTAQDGLFRAAIASSILSAIFTFFFGLAIFRIYADVRKTLSTAFLSAVLVSVALALSNAVVQMGAMVAVSDASYLKALRPEELTALAMIFLRMNNYGLGLAEVFAGIYLFTLGLVILETRSLPRILGVLLMIGACAFPVNTFMKILAPHTFPAMTQVTMMMNAFGAPLTMLWLLFKGVKEPNASLD
jgi:hypothetical protein